MKAGRTSRDRRARGAWLAAGLLAFAPALVRPADLPVRMVPTEDAEHIGNGPKGPRLPLHSKSVPIRQGGDQESLQRIAVKIAERLATARGARDARVEGGEAGRGAATLVVKQAASGAAAKPARHKASAARRSAAAQPEDAPAEPAPHRSGHWSYVGDNGPDAWGELKPEYALCRTGQLQSPIDIRGGFVVDQSPIGFDYRPSGMSVVDNGHTIQVNLTGGNVISVMGRQYELQSFHFHLPAEEKVDGRGYAMVMHLVHKDREGRLAVVAVLVEAGAAHPAVQAVWNNLPLQKNDPVAADQPFDPTRLLPEDRRYYAYLGSLTTPPCTEGVLWLVLKQPVTLSPEQLALFARLYPMNARPLQAAAGRLIKESR